MASRVQQCDICDASSTVCCIQSHQYYCDDCFKQHVRAVATEPHILIKNHQTSTQLSMCEHCGDQKDIVKICIVCKDIFCARCSDRHPKFTKSKGHSMISINEFHGSLCVERGGSRAESRPVTARSERSVSSKMSAQVLIAKPPDNNKYNGKLIFENTCAAPGESKMTRIRGMAILQDGRLLIIDAGNSCLKIFNAEFCDYVTRKELHDEPRGIAYISEDNFAISFAYKKEIVLYKIDKTNNIWQQKSIGMSDKPFSISYSKKTLAVEKGEGDDGKIVIIDFNGKITDHINVSSACAQFTGNSIRIAHEHDKKQVYIVNVQGVVHCISYEGDVIWKVQTSSPRGLAICGGILFVANKDNNKVYQIDTKTGELFNFLDEQDRILKPRFLAFSSIKQRLFVEVGSYFNVYKVTGGPKTKS